MISIISSNPAFGNHLPERSFTDSAVRGVCFQPHAIAYYSKLRSLCWRLTSAPVFVTCCSAPAINADAAPPEDIRSFILENTGIGYHVCIDQGEIKVAMIDVELNRQREIVSFYDIAIPQNGFAPDGTEVALAQVQAEEEGGEEGDDE
jgi:hypothetical protein